MDELIILCNKVIESCHAMIDDCDPPLVGKQIDDVNTVIFGANQFVQLMVDFGLNEASVSKLRAEKRHQEMGHISHEIRGPLGRMIGFSEILEFEHGETLTDCQLKYLREIGRANDEIEAIIYEHFDRDRE